MSALSACRKNLLLAIIGRSRGIAYRLISTSDKKKESSESCPPIDSIYKKVPDFSKPLENKNWVSFGFSKDDKDDDRFLMHITFFFGITVAMCGFLFINRYRPDRNREDWAKREAFIRLYEREQLGLEPIDPNYVDPSKVVLPPDEELSDEDIII